MAETVHHTTCPFCEALCGLKITTEADRVVSIRGNPDDPLSKGHICPKAVALQDVHEDPDRLRQPMKRVGEEWEAITWDEALDFASERIADVQRKHGQHAVATYLGNPVAHKYSMLLGAQILLGTLHTRNQYSASTVDQVPHMFAAWQMFGHPLLMPVPDVDRTNHLVVLGANPLVSNGSIMTAPDMKRRLKELRERGGKLVVVDPRRTETAEVADAFHFIRPGTDALMLLAWVHVLFEDGLAQTGGVNGAEELRAVVKEWTPERVADTTGVPADALRTMVKEHAAADGAALYGRLGVSTQEFGGLGSWLVYAISALTGNLDRPGGLMWTDPALDIVQLTTLAGIKGTYGRWTNAAGDLKEFNGELPAATMADQMVADHPDRIRALVTVAGNPVLSTPNGKKLAGAVADLDFYVAIDPWITATSCHADLVLPPVSHLETDHYGIAFHALAVRNTAKYCGPVFEPPKGALDDFEILTELAAGIAARSQHKAAGADRIKVAGARKLGARGLLDLGLKTGRHGALRRPFGQRLSLKKLEKMDAGVDLGPLESGHRMQTRDGRVHVAPPLIVDDLPRLEKAFEQDTLTKGLRLIGRRQLRGCNSWLHNSERMLKGKQRRCSLMMHPEDAASRGLKDGQTVTVSSRVGEVTTQLEVADVMQGVVSMPHGWGHAGTGARLGVATKAGGASINDLTDETHLDRLTGNAALSGVVVEVRG
jgi:anaerobic selenocysteine-containing dehydrogenase